MPLARVDSSHCFKWHDKPFTRKNIMLGLGGTFDLCVSCLKTPLFFSYLKNYGLMFVLKNSFSINLSPPRLLFFAAKPSPGGNVTA